MSWGIDIEKPDGEIIEIFDGHTYNLTPMWKLARVFYGGSRDLDGLRADALATLAARGLHAAVTKPEYFKKILTRTAILCAENRDGIDESVVVAPSVLRVQILLRPLSSSG